MRKTDVELKIVARAPIHHGGDEKTGVETTMRRMKYIVDGEIVEVPYISGNAIRGMLRRMVMKDLIERIGYEIKTPRLYHIVYSGGVLEDVGKESGMFNLEIRRKIRSLIPPISLLGTSFGNQVISGKLVVGNMLPYCRELNDFLPEKSNISFYELIDWTFNTRRDELREERAEDENAVQMKYNIEVFVPGTAFYQKNSILDGNEVEEACFSYMLQLWKQHPYIGGKSAIGFGEVDINIKKGELPPPDTYLKHIEENKEKILEVLNEMDTVKG